MSSTVTAHNMVFPGMLMTQSIPRNNVSMFVIAVKGSASIANIIHSP